MATAPIAGIAPAARRLGLPTKLAYGLGSTAYGIKDNGFSTLLLLFYNQVIGLPADLVGLAIMIALIVDAFVDPAIGHWSDHLSSRWGRRHPFMYAAALPVGALYLLLWNPPTGSHGETFVFLIVVAILVRTAISAYEVPSSALAPELTSDYHERTAVLGWRYLFGWMGGMGMLLLTFGVFLAPGAHPSPALYRDGFRTYSYVAASVMAAAILLSALGTHREIAHLPRVIPGRTSLAATLRDIGRALGNRAFRMLLLSGVFAFTAQGLTFALSVYINTHYWAFSTGVLTLFTLGVIGGVALAFWIAGIASRRWDKRRAAALMMGCYPIVGVSGFVLRRMGLMPANGDPALIWPLMAITVLATALGVGAAILTGSMMADVVEDAQMRTGERNEGVFFAGSFFMQKCVSGLGLFLSGAILSLVHFPAQAAVGTVPASVLNNLILVYGILLIALSVIAASFIWRFPLGGLRAHEERLADLAADAARVVPLPGSEAGETVGDPGATPIPPRHWRHA